MAGAITNLAREARRRWAERVEKQLDPDLPGYMVRSEWKLDDGCQYDRGYDPRPEFVREDDARLRRRGGA